jgi:aminoglycoside phosphotransferase (APT) family kinase protein
MELAAEIIGKMARQAFPEATVVSYRLLEGGVTNLNLALELKNPKTEVALRVYRPDVPAQTVEKEMYVLRVVMPETGVPTPRVIRFDDSQVLVDRPYAVLSLLPGERLEQALPRMDEMDQETVGYEAGRYLAKLHSIPLDRFGEFLGQDPRASVDEKAYTVALVLEWLDICEEHDLLDRSAVAELRRLAGRTRALNRESACFVHGDYHGGNINVEEGWGGYHVIGVFDFAYAQGWSPEWDMVGLYSDVAENRPSLAKGFLDGYADTVGLPENLWQRLQVYESVVLVAAVVRAHRANDAALLSARQDRLYRFLEWT